MYLPPLSAMPVPTTVPSSLTVKAKLAMYRCFLGIGSRIKLGPTLTVYTQHRVVTFSDTTRRRERLPYPGFPTIYNAFLPQNGIITLTTHYPHHLPHAGLLGTHATIAQILHATCMGQYIENTLEEWHLIHRFALDGTIDVAPLLMVFYSGGELDICTYSRVLKANLVQYFAQVLAAYMRGQLACGLSR